MTKATTPATAPPAPTLRLDVRPRLKQLGRTEEWLSEESGVTLRTIRDHYRGMRRAFKWPTLDRLCRALACQPAALLFQWVDARDETPNDDREVVILESTEAVDWGWYSKPIRGRRHWLASDGTPADVTHWIDLPLTPSGKRPARAFTPAD